MARQQAITARSGTAVLFLIALACAVLVVWIAGDQEGSGAAADPQLVYKQSSMVSPLAGATVDGAIRFGVRPESGFQRVVFKLDGTTLAEDRSVPLSMPVDTTTIADGTHTTVATLTASDGSRRTLRATFDVDNSTRETVPAPAPEHSPTEEPDAVLLVVGDAESLNASERHIHDRLRTRNHTVTIADDDQGTVAPDEHDLIIISKTVTSTKVGDRFKATTAGVVNWEDNAQAIEQGGELDVADTGTKMLAWIDLVNPQGTSWHGSHTTWRVHPDAPTALRNGLSGRVPVYRISDEMTYAPAGTLPDNAITVASYGSGEDRPTFYVYDRNTRLPDGTTTPGRRVYFGLYDDTFTNLTDAGLQLFDAATEWAAAPTGARSRSGM